ncbi:MAG: hypothetical protein JWM55_1468 [Acidimicrobiaceae bacterium]|nr:hypothetical protein [Acidimicrobiaceae bacterium]
MTQFRGLKLPELSGSGKELAELAVGPDVGDSRRLQVACADSPIA